MTVIESVIRVPVAVVLGLMTTTIQDVVVVDAPEAVIEIVIVVGIIVTEIVPVVVAMSVPEDVQVAIVVMNVIVHDEALLVKNFLIYT